MESRRALSVGVGSFDGYEQLEFAPGLSDRLGAVFADLEYKVTVVAKESLHGKELAAEVNNTLTGKPSDIAVVHLITHGEPGPGGATVFALGSDSKPHADASVAHWLTVQEAGDRPTTLFLLDLCGAGTLARLPWQARTEKPLRGWVIAACGEREAAYDGRFSQAVISVLEALRAGELDIDPSLRHVPLATFARAVRAEVNRLAAEVDSFPQQVTASLVDISSDVEPPFFPNPAYNPASKPRLRASVDPGLLPFLDDLDEGLDARHFLERATGLGRLTDAGSGLVGCFTGRDRELRQVSPWLSGEGSAPLCVVTGSPGAGKSALLGVLVCAAHRSLREATRPIWGQIVQAPVRIDDLAAVHTRQRVLGAVTASIARQLDLPENLTAAELVDALRRRPARPVLVVDALDEADDPLRLITELLLPLVSEKTPGNPVRLLVGVRLYDEYQPLFDRAWMINLDEVEQHVLEDDLLDYVQGLLRTTSEYRKQGGAVGAFAQAVASVLAKPDVDGGRRWGPFLVAGLYTRHFMTANADRVVTDAAVAAKEGAKVPADLRGVLELDLRLEHDELWLRPVLTALAYARGTGMPVSVLTRVTAAFAPAGTRPTTGQIRSALNVARFYVRQSLAPDRSNVYRLFHQGLADTLAEQSAKKLGAVLDALVSSLGPPNQRDWNAAEPYVLRYVPTHASAAGRVEEIEADPGFVLHPGSPLRTEAEDAAELALIAVRKGNRALARRAANLPGSPPLVWQPCWSIGTLASSAWNAEVISAPSRFESIAISDNGESVVALGSDGLACWEWASDGPPRLRRVEARAAGHEVLLSPLGTVFALGDSGMVFEFGNEEVWERDGLDPVRAAAISGPSEIVYVDHAGEIVRHDLVTLRRDVVGSTGHNLDLWSIADIEGGIVAVAFANRMRLKVFTYPGNGYALRALQHPILTFAISPDGRHVVAGTEGGWLAFAQLQEHVVWKYADRLNSEITAVAATSGASRLAAGCEDGTVVLFGPDGRSMVMARASHHPIRKLALCLGTNRGLALDDDGKAHWFDFGVETGSVTAPLPVVAGSSTGDPVVTAFLTKGDEITVGMSDGTVAAVVIGTGELRQGTRLDAAARKLALVDLGGRVGTLVATGAGYNLLHGHFDHVIDLGSAGWAKEHLSSADSPPRIGVGSGVVEVWHEDDSVWIRKLRSSPDLELVDNIDLELGDHKDCQVVQSAYFGLRPLAFSGGLDGSVGVWDLESLEMVDTLPVGGPVRDIRTVSGRYLLVLAGGELLAFEHHDGSRKGSS